LRAGVKRGSDQTTVGLLQFQIFNFQFSICNDRSPAARDAQPLLWPGAGEIENCPLKIENLSLGKPEG
jgi:hypothetical protein